MDPLKCQTSTATPAEPGGLSLTLGMVGLRFRIKHYRAKAAEAEENARQAKDPDARATYLKAAASWHRLADLLAVETLELQSRIEKQD
jgi:hypothetical protein